MQVGKHIRRPKLSVAAELTNRIPDDDQYTAHAALLGLPEVGHIDLTSGPFAATDTAMAQDVVGQTGQACKKMTECTFGNNPGNSSCEPGWTIVGWEQGSDDCSVRGFTHTMQCVVQYGAHLLI
jgi:hypothetical protein